MQLTGLLLGAGPCAHRPRWRRDKLGGLGQISGAQQPLEQRLQIGFARRQRAQPRRARFTLQLQRRRQQPVQPVPVPTLRSAIAG